MGNYNQCGNVWFTDFITIRRKGMSPSARRAVIKSYGEFWNESKVSALSAELLALVLQEGGSKSIVGCVVPKDIVSQIMPTVALRIESVGDGAVRVAEVVGRYDMVPERIIDSHLPNMYVYNYEGIMPDYPTSWMHSSIVDLRKMCLNPTYLNVAKSHLRYICERVFLAITGEQMAIAVSDKMGFVDCPDFLTNIMDLPEWVGHVMALERYISREMESLIYCIEKVVKTIKSSDRVVLEKYRPKDPDLMSESLVKKWTKLFDVAFLVDRTDEGMRVVRVHPKSIVIERMSHGNLCGYGLRALIAIYGGEIYDGEFEGEFVTALSPKISLQNEIWKLAQIMASPDDREFEALCSSIMQVTRYCFDDGYVKIRAIIADKTNKGMSYEAAAELNVAMLHRFMKNI
jgi:hypothetical protein